MTLYERSEIDIIDQRVRAAMRKDRDVGTVVSRAPSGVGAMVTFDGSYLAVPCKVLAHVNCQPGDRVLLERWHTTWVVVGTYAQRGLGHVSRQLFSTGDTTTSGTYVDYPSATLTDFVKLYDWTWVRLAMTGACWSTLASTTVRFAARLHGTDWNMAQMSFSVANNAQWGADAMARIPDIPAGTYEIVPRWRRVSGSGVLSTSSTTFALLEAEEIPPPAGA